MSISPATDIVLDVMKAADPARVALTEKRLLAADGGGEPPFSVLVSPAVAFDARQPATAARPFAPSAGPGSAARARMEFESLVLGTFISQMLPKQGEGLFDHGPGSDMWRSILGEQIARQIAKSGRTGMGDCLFATHELAAPRASPRHRASDTGEGLS